jgi:anionic cell wall polymer biosynthesis LytR-Cps2A-Psr (LCP) family protein
MNKKQPTRLHRITQKRVLLQNSAIVLGIIFIIIGALIVGRFLGFYNAIHAGSQPPKKQTEQKKKTEYNFLLMGYGGGYHEGTFLTDTIMVVHIDLEKKRALLVSLPRDIWVKVPTKDGIFHSKINAVYQMALFPDNYPNIDSSLISEENPSGLIKQVVEDITGLEIDAYATIDFNGFIKAVDTLGSIEINVERSFTDYEYPLEGKEDELCEREEEFVQIEPILNDAMRQEDIDKLFAEKPELQVFYDNIQNNLSEAFPCRFEELHFDAGLNSMDGETALKYARSRHSLEDGGDFNRAKRQQNVLEAMKRKVLAIGFIPKIVPLLNELEDHIATDLPLGELNTLLLEGRNADKYTAETLVISDDFITDAYSDEGQYIVIPKLGIDDWSDVKKTIDNLKKGITPSPIVIPTEVGISRFPSSRE